MKKMIIMAAAALLLVAAPATQARTKKATAKAAATSQVIYTGEIAKKVIGYNGTTPLNITIKGGKIEKIEALENEETPAYFKRACDKVFPQYEGKTIEEARKLQPDAATGATYSSEALIKNIQAGLEQVKSSSKKATSKKKTSKKRRR